MWVSEKEGVSALFQQQIDAFEAANPGIVINAQIEGVTEADAGSLVVTTLQPLPTSTALHRTSSLVLFRLPLSQLPVRQLPRTSSQATMQAP
ncbi:MAG: hypothetical protein IKJ80_07710 [Clostridia bacterium]|nr:hypothetical protein [Clostridia bacterium]